MKFYLSTFLLFVFSIHSNGQHKLEHEKRTVVDSVPDRAVRFISNIQFDTKVKWYKEIGLDGISWEAKAKKNKKKYSIEFDKKGKLEDLEITVLPRDVPSALNKNILLYFKSQYTNHKIAKLQIQYIGSDDNILRLINKNERYDLTQNFEIIARIINKNETFSQELLFSETGQLLSTKLIIDHYSDLLEF